MKNTQKGFVNLLLILLVLAVGGWVVESGKWKVKSNEPKPEDGVVCTMEAKQCPDGSFVGRTGPKCEFSACPTTTGGSKEGTTAALNQKILLGGGVYVTPIKVVSDSRCPVDVTCIWAGEVTLKVKLEKGAEVKEVDVKEGGSVSFGGANISLVSVTPANNTKKPITDKDYRFTFQMSSSEKVQGSVSGKVTISPTCGGPESTPPNPGCAPKPYATSIAIVKSGTTQTYKTIKSDTNGEFSVSLDAGSYILKAQGGSVLPRCGEVTVEVKSGEKINADISCDSGIR